jgi:hypothetical protein
MLKACQGPTQANLSAATVMTIKVFVILAAGVKCCIY